MKKIDLLHLTLLIVGILSGYAALQDLINELSILAYLGDPYFQFSYRASLYIILAIGHAIVCISLIANGRRYAGTLLKDELEGSWEEASRWDLDRRNTLFVLFIGMGLYAIMQSAVSVLGDFFELFSAKVDYTAMGHTPKRTFLLTDLLRLTIGTCIVYAAPTLTNFIENNIAARMEGGKQPG